MSLDDFLAQKPLHYDEIDYTRMPRAYRSIKEYIKLPKIIQIVGTNGKGSTGRFLSNILLKQNLSVGHYTSPHIFKFNERIWLNGENVSDEVLEKTHTKLQKLLSDEFLETLSYFEYTTFLAILIFSKNCDYIVLEAGLGGEFDATSVFPNILNIITPIGYDHQAFLGESVAEIATTKLNSIQNTALLSYQYESEVYEIAKNICINKNAKLYLCKNLLTKMEEKKIDKFIEDKKLPIFQNINLKTAYCGTKLLGFKEDIDIYDLNTMVGRCQKIAKNITIDVGHNKMAAMAMRKYFNSAKVTLVYNSFKDKEYKDILEILFPIVERLELLQVDNLRPMATNEIRKICEETHIEVCDFKKIENDREYLVFGSFVVVEKFLEIYEK